MLGEVQGETGPGGHSRVHVVEGAEIAMPCLMSGIVCVVLKGR